MREAQRWFDGMSPEHRRSASAQVSGLYLLIADVTV